ncbi:MAG TPA: hypothetical protein VNO32_35870 [Candidatus Acidoferrum sp.]|nr:hypothetical protein [Candidatus Acidoferrum sp.]
MNRICVVIFAVLVPFSVMHGTAQRAINSPTAAQCQLDATIWLPTLEAQGATIAITHETAGLNLVRHGL